MKKEDARYARYMAGELVSMRYQCRMGVLSAGEFGSAQVGLWCGPLCADVCLVGTLCVPLMSG